MMKQSEFSKLAVASYERDKTTGMLMAEDGSTIYFIEGQAVTRSEFDAASGLAHLSEIGFDASSGARNSYEVQCVRQAVEPAPAWFTSFAMVLADTLPPVVMIGQCRSGKTRLAGVLIHEVLKHGVRASIREHQSVIEVDLSTGAVMPEAFRPEPGDREQAVRGALKDVHLVAFRQQSLWDAELVSEALNRRITPKELSSLPQWHAVIRLAGQDSVAVVDTEVLYPDS